MDITRRDFLNGMPAGFGAELFYTSCPEYEHRIMRQMTRLFSAAGFVAEEENNK